ncbi:MAG: NifU family protein [Coriobacteriales bacterium]
MVDKDKVGQVIELVRPALQADGGDIKLVEVSDDGIVKVKLLGHCAGCPMSQMTLSEAVERTLKEHVAGVKRVVPVQN